MLDRMNRLETEQLRDKHRRERADLSVDIVQSNSRGLCRHVSLLTEFKSAVHVAAYVAIRGEIDVGPLMHIATGKQYYLPVLQDGAMHFAPWGPGKPLLKKGFGLLEPDTDPSLWIKPAQLDLVLAPLVVFDSQCNRIGQGGGYYDRTFAFKKTVTNASASTSVTSSPVLLGVAHESQREARLEPEQWDVPLDAVATEHKVYRNDVRRTPD